MRRLIASNGSAVSAVSSSATKRLSLAHPFLIAVLMIAVQYAQNVDETEAFVVLRLMAVVLLATGVLFALARLATRNWVQAALVTSIFNVLFFGYGRVFGALAYQKTIAMQPATWHAALLSMSFGLVVVAAVLIRQSRRDWQPLSRFFTSVLTIVLALTVWNIVAGEQRNSRQLGRTKKTTALSAKDFVPAAPIATDAEDHPDVYYIILDTYCRADVLQSVFGHDNSPFLDDLKSRGFYVAEESCSNYPYTFMSLASSLQMRFLEAEVAAGGKQKKPSRRPFNELIQNALAPRIFQSKGYRYVHIASNVSMTQTSDIADTVLGHYPSWLQNEFTQVLLSTTALRVLEPSTAQIHLNAFAQLKEVAKIEGPTFAFAHIVCPHRPIVFNCDGKILDDQPQDLVGEGDRAEAFRKGYIGQLSYVNKRVCEVVDEIVAQSKTPPIIIIHGDHGTATLGQSSTTDTLLNSEIVSRERLPILNAYLVPEKMREKLYPTISPVNTFRMLLTECFGENFPLLPDRNLLGWYNKPFDLTDVTEWVHSHGAPTAEEVRIASQPVQRLRTPRQGKKAGSSKRV